jgi:hypothetical protein
VLTERARAVICQRVGLAEHSVAHAARDFGLSWHAAMAAVRDHGQPASTTWPAWVHRVRSGWTRRRSWPPPPGTRRCW